MTQLGEFLQRFLVVAAPVVAALGGLVAAWSALRTRREYYDNYIKNRKKIDD